MINVISQVEKVLSGEEYDAEIQKRQLGMETAQQAIEYLQTQVGNGFPKQAELEAAEERIAELEEQMKVELAAIEAQEETDKSGTATTMQETASASATVAIRSVPTPRQAMRSWLAAFAGSPAR